MNEKIINKIRWLFGKKKKLLIKAKVGLALGSGGSLGLSHIGVIKVLKENNIPISHIAGSSIGALIGAYYALNPNVKKLENTAISVSKWELIKLIDVNIPKTSLISGNRIRKFITELIEDKSFSDTKIPLKIITTDLELGKEVIIDKGNLIDAIMASISIPGVFPPVRLKERLLIDGGVINPTPTNIVKKMGSEVVIGVDLTMESKAEFKNPNIFQTLMRTYDIHRTQLTKFNIDGKDNNLVIIKPDTTKLKSFKYHEIQKFIEEGERVAKEALPEIKKLIKNAKSKNEKNK